MSYFRGASTNQFGNEFDETTKDQVWKKGKIDNGFDPKIFRKDVCNASMKYDDYGDTSSDWGWEIDHIIPVSKGGGDELSNLQPLHWKNNRAKGDNLDGDWDCAKTY